MPPTISPAIWSPDGADVVFASRRKGHLNLYRKTASGAREEVLLEDQVDKTPTSWSSDGKFILYSIAGPQTGPDIWVLPLAGDRKPLCVPRVGHRRTVRAILAGWPLGRVRGVGVRPLGGSTSQQFPARARSSRSRVRAGAIPAGGRTGRNCSITLLDNKLMAATVRADGGRVGHRRRPAALRNACAGRPAAQLLRCRGNGQRFMIVVPDDTASTPITLVSNWPTLVKTAR